MLRIGSLHSEAMDLLQYALLQVACQSELAYLATNLFPPGLFMIHDA